MKSWKNNRPDNWPEFKKAGAKRWFDETGSGTFSFPHFEAGADAMLESLASLVGEDGYISFEKEDGKVVAVYIIRRLKNEQS